MRSVNNNHAAFLGRNGVIRTRSHASWLAALAWPVLGTVALVLLLGGVGMLDDLDRIKLQRRQAEHEALLRHHWEQGRQVGHQEAAHLQLADKRSAYVAGLDEGQERCVWGKR